MEPLYDFGLQATRWLQTTYPQLTAFLSLISELGRFEFYLAIIPLVYWCINKSFGKQLAYLLAVSNLLIAAFKHLLHTPRPDWLDPSLGLGAETSYGVPSGHTQSATVAYLFLAYWLRRGWAWLLAFLMIFLMGLSRIYLGVHFPHDVLAGLLLGLLLLSAYLVWLDSFQEPFGNRILGQRLLAAVLLPLAIVALYTVLRLLLGSPSDDVSWSASIPGAERVSLEEVASAFGVLLGMGVGFILEATRVHFLVDGSLGRRALRYLLGIFISLAIWRGLALIFPEDPLWLALPLRVLRYWLLGIWAAYYAPLFFVRLHLAEASPEPEVKLTVSEGGIMRG